MIKIAVFLTLFFTYAVYTATVYTRGTRDTVQLPDSAYNNIVYGKQIFQDYNCTACHQLYGLGGYLGPELTTTYSDPLKGEPFIRALLKGGGLRMPNFHLKDPEINALVSFLKYVDSSAVSYKSQPKNNAR